VDVLLSDGLIDSEDGEEVETSKRAYFNVGRYIITSKQQGVSLSLNPTLVGQRCYWLSACVPADLAQARLSSAGGEGRGTNMSSVSLVCCKANPCFQLDNTGELA
jgi:hypothetical protein